MSPHDPAFSADSVAFRACGIDLSNLAPLIDGEEPSCGSPVIASSAHGAQVSWRLADAPGERVQLAITWLADARAWRLDVMLEGVRADARLDSIGLRIGSAAGVLRYLRNGYTSWDGSYFVELESARDLVAADPRATVGHALTALVADAGTVVLGFLRHDRYQSRFRFALTSGPLSVDAETLVDRVPHTGSVAAESLVLLGGAGTEETLRRWSRLNAAASPRAPRVAEKRIAGWCSWYSLYNYVNEALVLEHLAAARRFRDRYRVPFDVFQIDDGFTPEMGDWLDVKPQFPRGMQPPLEEIRAAGFVPGLWIAPWMVGNRSRLFAEHPDWVVKDRTSGEPLAPMTFYGEFRWGKRSEEYYVLDVTRPDAEAWIRRVLHTWRHIWGCAYFKTDFMYFGSEYGPGEARWHEEGLSRMQVWMRMATLIREEIGDALWLVCGGPVWAAVGLADAVRIGRDVGVSWKGHYSAESLLRDHTSRNFANGIFWQADPDCILLRGRFHHLTDEQVRTLALFAGLAGGVLMTSDQLDEVPEARRELFAELARECEVRACDFPLLGRSTLQHRIVPGHTGQPTLVADGDPVLVQRVPRRDGTTIVNVLNTGDTEARRCIDWTVAGFARAVEVRPLDAVAQVTPVPRGAEVVLPPWTSCRLLYTPGRS